MQKKVLITGGSGSLGRYLCNYFVNKKYFVIGLYNTNPISINGIEEIKIDLTNSNHLSSLIERYRPDLIIHTVALTNVDECEQNPNLARLLNVDIANSISILSKKFQIKLVHISTDHLWDGTIPYVEEISPLSPMNVYGLTKALAEESVLKNDSDALIIRTNFFGFGLPNKKSLADWILNSLERKEIIKGFDDVFFTPISIKHLSDYILKLVEINEKGIFHIVGKTRISKYEFAIKIAEYFQKPTNLILKSSIHEVSLKAKRPMDMSLSSQKISKVLNETMPEIEESLEAK